MKLRRTAKSVFATVGVLSALSCSTPEPESQRYQNLDYDTKTVFLTYYPYLSREQKDELLSGEKPAPEELIQSWAGQFNDPTHEVGSFEEMMNNPRNRKISSLEIQIDSPDLITSGTQLTAHAFAIYASGKKTEVTQDVEWRIEPQLGRMDKNVLEYECADSDLTLVADFLQEKEASKLVTIRKPIESLELSLSESAIEEDGSYRFQLTATAHCKDGGTSDVSCQASWRPGNVSGCGTWIVGRKERASGDPLTITATYGGRSAHKTLKSPIR